MSARNLPCYTRGHVSLRAEAPTEDAEAQAAAGPKIVGYGAVFYDGTPASEYELFSGFIERIMPGAFDRAIREDDVRSFFNHDMNWVLGRNRADPPTLALATDETGLRYEIDPPATQAGRDITGVRLYEVGPVVFPAYETTSVELRRRYVESRRAALDLFRGSHLPKTELVAAGLRAANIGRLARARTLN